MKKYIILLGAVIMATSGLLKNWWHLDIPMCMNLVELMIGPERQSVSKKAIVFCTDQGLGYKNVGCFSWG